MKRTSKQLLLCLTLILPLAGFGQDKNDFMWILGYAPSNQNLYFGGNNINFITGAPDINYFHIDYDMDNPVCMADDEGHLQFYSSGCNVINYQHAIMENGDDLSPGFYHDYYCEDNNLGYLSGQAIFSLPVPSHPGEYILLHHRRFMEQDDSIQLLYTKIDMNANAGLGKVVEKNTVLQFENLARTYTAVRHGNGRDWWVVVPKENSDIYYFYLLDPEGLHGPISQQVSTSWINGQPITLKCAFSPDGTKFVRIGTANPAKFRMYGFDRCTGLLSNPVDIAVPDTIMYAPWLCFSPNSRYLYLTNKGEKLYQYDTYASNVSASVQLIDTYDGFVSIYGLPTSLFAMALGPDNRIYMTSASGVNSLHTIHNPDEAGVACNFRQHDVYLPAHNKFLLPNHAFYRLYNIEGALCDTLEVQPPLTAFWRSEQDSLTGPLTIYFTDLSYYKPTCWYWNFGDGTSDTTQFPVHNFSAPGVYTVCLEVCNADGVYDTLCREVEIITVGTESPLRPGTSSRVKIFPNPVYDDLNVLFDDFFSGTVEIFDLSGCQVLLEENIMQRESLQLKIGILKPGVYFLTTTDLEGVRTTTRFAFFK